MQDRDAFEPDEDIYYFILLLPIGNHCIVALCLINEETALVVDGSNEVYFDDEFRIEVSSILKLEVRALEFTQQKFVDRCAASAAAICIEFMRLYSNKAQLESVGNTIRVEPEALEVMEKTLYKYPSERIAKGRFDPNLIEYPECPKCGKHFRSAKRQKITSHVRMCRG